jgi:dCMP deaminase
MRKDIIDWAIDLAVVAATRSEDPYKKVGSVALRPDNSIAAVSYNGAPPKVNIDWSDREKRRSFVIHSEMNLLRYIKPGECNRVAVTLSPCIDCLKNLSAYGIKQVFYVEEYKRCDFSLVKEIANLFNIELIQR